MIAHTTVAEAKIHCQIVAYLPDCPTCADLIAGRFQPLGALVSHAVPRGMVPTNRSACCCLVTAVAALRCTVPRPPPPVAGACRRCSRRCRGHSECLEASPRTRATLLADPKRQRGYVSCGAGLIDAFEEASNRYQGANRLKRGRPSHNHKMAPRSMANFLRCRICRGPDLSFRVR
jgi:hypothetical protein